MPIIDANGARLFYRFDGPPEAPVLMLSNSLGTVMQRLQTTFRAYKRN